MKKLLAALVVLILMFPTMLIGFLLELMVQGYKNGRVHFERLIDWL